MIVSLESKLRILPVESTGGVAFEMAVDVVALRCRVFTDAESILTNFTTIV